MHNNKTLGKSINKLGDHQSMMEIRDTFRGGHDAKIETPKGIKEGEV